MSAEATRRTLAALGLPQDCLLVLLGISGAGKTTLANTLFPAAAVLSADHLRDVLTGDPGNQDASRAAWAMLHSQLDHRLGTQVREGVPTVVDAVNAEAWVRRDLIAAGRSHGMPVVALVVDVDLDTALARNAARDRRVPPDIIAAQHEELTKSLPGLPGEGFTAVRHARDLPVLDVILERSAAGEKTNPVAHIERAFGRDLARLFTRHDGEDEDGYLTGAFVVGGRELPVRWTDEDDPDDVCYRARITCPDCGGPAWMSAYSAKDLRDAVLGSPPYADDCPHCY
ncbi:AAA family ATPase [Kitasatospora sp. NBC_01300]|uniref:AAA family ATPase n=1 Tax=Kitasatospora sp. NBC_01300 TaxID=2903574 RepID=UPI002F917E39|nr:AAA family ATPase [Kitasatospora sp. NBC_01300]